MNASQLQSQLNQKQKEAKGLLAEFQRVATKAERAITPSEMAVVEAAVEECRGIKARLDSAASDSRLLSTIEQMTAGMTGDSTPPSAGGTLGQQFINSETFRWLKETKDRRPTGSWSSPSSELMAATLTENSASGGALVIPDYRPGIVEQPTRPLVMADLIAPGVTESNLITYMRELSYSNAAATVLEGAAKPESTVTFEAVSDPVRKIAHWIPVTEEMLEDVPALKSYLGVRLDLGVRLTEDFQLLNGSTVAPDVVGFLNRTGLATPIARGVESSADAILRQIAAIFVATGLQPTGIVMNPVNFLTIQLLKSAAGEYIAGNGPFSAPQAPTLWGVPVALTSAMTANTALVGAFRTAAQLFRKGGLRVEASNSHASFFIENKVAIRAEERLALAVYRPAAFGIVTGLN